MLFLLHHLSWQSFMAIDLPELCVFTDHLARLRAAARCGAEQPWSRCGTLSSLHHLSFVCPWPTLLFSSVASVRLYVAVGVHPWQCALLTHRPNPQIPLHYKPAVDSQHHGLQQMEDWTLPCSPVLLMPCAADAHTLLCQPGELPVPQDP